MTAFIQIKNSILTYIQLKYTIIHRSWVSVRFQFQCLHIKGVKIHRSASSFTEDSSKSVA